MGIIISMRQSVLFFLLKFKDLKIKKKTNILQQHGFSQTNCFWRCLFDECSLLFMKNKKNL